MIPEFMFAGTNGYKAQPSVNSGSCLLSGTVFDLTPTLKASSESKLSFQFSSYNDINPAK